MSFKLLLCGLLLINFLSVNAQNRDEEVLIETRSLQSAAIKSVLAETDNGNISVAGVTDSEARVEVYAWSREPDEKVKKLFAETYDVKISTDNNKLTVSCKLRNRNRNSNISVSFRLYVPAASSTQLSTSGGNLHAMKMNSGKHQLTTSGGNIAFDDVKGEVSGKTSGGNISVSNCSESVEVFTSGGNISARESNGKLKLSTSGGNIALDELSGETRAETSGGNIAASDISGVLNTSSSGGNLSLVRMSCALEASTSGGHLVVEMRKLDRYVRLRNRGSGTTELRLPQDAGIDLSASGHSVKLDHARGFSGDMNEREVKGKLGGGGLPVTIDGGDSRVVVSLK